MTHVAEESGRRTPAPNMRSGERGRSVARYVAEFERFDRSTASHQPAWLAEARRAAIARFGELGFPTTRQEAWRFTSVTPIAEQTTALSGDGQAAINRDALQRLMLDGTSALAVFVNGRFAPDLSVLSSLPAGVVVSSLKTALESHAELVEAHLTQAADHANQAFVALNTAFLEDGGFIFIPDHTVVSGPLHVVFLSTGQPDATPVSHPRVLIVTGEHSQVQIVESYAGANERPYFTNAVTEVVAGANAVIDHYKLQRESSKAFHLGSMYLTAQRGSTFSSHSLTLGGSLVRNDVLAALRGEGIDCTLNGLYLVGGAALVDNHTTIDHAMPHCGSHEVYKGILWGRARAVFNGKIIVRPDAQKTDAKQTNKALLLSDDAQINTKPELEIFANDVKCTHGAAIGQLDDDALFYLRSRGLGHAEARAMLIHAFAGDIINRVKVPALRAQLETALLTVLPQETA
jgi:Fe-S cluster assembly protein SufD